MNFPITHSTPECATRRIDRVSVPPPHGAWQASKCSNTRIAATHTRPWSNIRDRIEPLYCSSGTRCNGQTVTASGARLAASIG